MLFLGVAAAPTWLRLCVAAPPGIILFVWYLSSRGRFAFLRTVAAWVIVLALALGEVGERLIVPDQVVKLPIGQMAVFNPVQYQEISFLLDHTKPGDYFFGSAELAYLLDLRNPSPIPYVTPSDYTRPEQVEETIAALKKYPVKYVYWESIFDMPPQASQGANHLRPLRDYLASHYLIVKTIEGDDYARSFWEKVGISAPTPIRRRIASPPPAQTGESPTGAGSNGGSQATPLDAPAQAP